MIRRILGLCARDHGHKSMYELLARALSDFQINQLSWENLIFEAERQGVAPLLYKHLNHISFTLPDGWHRILRSLYQRSRSSSRIRNRALVEILESYQSEKIDILLVKGIALGNFIYDSPELRPMRDIDLLARKTDLTKAREILLDLGYQQDQSHHIPDDYYHLPPMVKTIEGLPVTIELHHNLLPFHGQYPLWPLEKSFFSARPIQINDLEVYTLNPEDSLHYTYLHGFRAPLTYEEFRFIHIGDMISLVEKFFELLDWERMRAEFKLMPAILSRFHFVTPWQDRIINGLKLEIRRSPDKPGAPYLGWPQRKIKDTSLKDLPQLLYRTLWPSQWWTQMYYGHLKGLGYIKVRLFEHPQTIWRWVKIFLQ